MGILRRYPWLGIIAIFMLTASAVVFINKANQQDTNRKICRAVLGNSLLLRDLIDKSIAASTNPNAQVLAQDFYTRIELPPEICHGTGIDVKDFFKRDPSTTTTTLPGQAPAEEGQDVQGVQGVQGQQGNRGSQGVQGVQGPAGPPGTAGPNSSPSTTTTTTTTQPSRPILPPITLPPHILSAPLLRLGSPV